MEINIVLVMLDSIPCLVGDDLSEAESKEMEKSPFFNSNNIYGNICSKSKKS